MSDSAPRAETITRAGPARRDTTSAAGSDAVIWTTSKSPRSRRFASAGSEPTVARPVAVNSGNRLDGWQNQYSHSIPRRASPRPSSSMELETPPVSHNIRKSRTRMLPPRAPRAALRRELIDAHHLAHRDHDLARSLERVAGVRDEHVVAHDHVTLLPLEAHAHLLEHLAQVLHRLVGDRRAVAVVHVARQVFLVEQRPQPVAGLFVHAVDVVDLHLVEEHLLERLRVLHGPLRPVDHAQPAVGAPLEIAPGVAAHLLHLRLVRRVEELLPRRVDALREVAHVHESLRAERLDDLRVDVLQHFTRVEHRRAATH